MPPSCRMCCSHWSLALRMPAPATTRLVCSVPGAGADVWAQQRKRLVRADLKTRGSVFKSPVWHLQLTDRVAL